MINTKTKTDDEMREMRIHKIREKLEKSSCFPFHHDQSFWRTRRNTLQTSNIKFLFIPAVKLFRRPRRNPLTRQFTCDLSLLNTLAELKWQTV